MSDYVVDASVVIKWFLPEPDAEAARRLRREDLQCEAPDLLLLEVSNALWKYVIRGTLELEIARDAVEAFSIAPIRLHPVNSLFADAFQIAIETRRSVYDCAYLSLAMRATCPLVTADRKFYEAIKPGRFGPHVFWVGDL